MNTKIIHILLADDDENDRMLFKLAFSELKIKTHIQTVNNGIELLDYLSINKDTLPYLLFLDLNMAHKNGLECLKEIKRNEKLKDIFISIFSTSDNEKDIKNTFKSGANMFITKPHDFKILKKILEKAVIIVNQNQGQPTEWDSFLVQI